MSAPRDDWDEALSIAVEHVGWCRSIGMSPRRIERVFGASMGASVTTSWDEITWAVAREWTQLDRDKSSRRDAEHEPSRHSGWSGPEEQVSE